MSTSTEGLSSRRCITTLSGDNKGTEKIVLRILSMLRIMLKNSRQCICLLLGLFQENKWYGSQENKPNGGWDEVSDNMMLNSSESGPPVFRGSSASQRGDLKSKGKGKSSTHFNGSDETVEVVLRTIISVNQLCIYGAVADMCGKLAWEVTRHSKGTGKPVVPENLETMVMPPEESTTDQFSPTDARVQGNL